ncbi:hypothetical protein E4U51_000078 [Claviceps purpurea]|nr:hypothetical protein E4U51_000078 [Claviceps purpurea]
MILNASESAPGIERQASQCETSTIGSHGANEYDRASASAELWGVSDGANMIFHYSRLHGSDSKVGAGML